MTLESTTVFKIFNFKNSRDTWSSDQRKPHFGLSGAYKMKIWRKANIIINLIIVENMFHSMYYFSP